MVTIVEQKSASKMVEIITRVLTKTVCEKYFFKQTVFVPNFSRG